MNVISTLNKWKTNIKEHKEANIMLALKVEKD
jgi:hypothetical protein